MKKKDLDSLRRLMNNYGARAIHYAIDNYFTQYSQNDLDNMHLGEVIDERRKELEAAGMRKGALKVAICEYQQELWYDVPNPPPELREIARIKKAYQRGVKLSNAWKKTLATQRRGKQTAKRVPR